MWFIQNKKIVHFLGHSVHWGIKPLKNTTPFFLANPLLNMKTAQAPFLGNPPLYIGFP